MKPIPALALFLAGLLAGTALTWLALRPAPLTSAPVTHAPDAGTARVAAGITAGAGDEGDDEGDDDDGVESVASEGTGKPRAVPVALVEVPRAEIVDHDSWAKQGFARMTPPVRLPSDGAGRDKIEVWLRIPDGSLIQGRKLADGRATIELPPGTVADRVESWGYAPEKGGGWQYSVIDVRGTRLAADGTEMFHVFVPSGPDPLAPLVGWEWRRGDELEQQAATSLLVGHLETLRTIQERDRPLSDDERRRFIGQYRRNNDCARCHAYDKPVQTARARGIHRATDHNGFYVPLSVLHDTVPLERHRPRDMNVGDPFLTFTCPHGEGPTLAEGEAGARDLRCLDGGAPSATLDVKRALAAGDERTVALCRSRAWLRERMDDNARALFAPAFAACGL